MTFTINHFDVSCMATQDEIKTIKKAKYNLDKLAGIIQDLRRGAMGAVKITDGETYTLQGLKWHLLGGSSTNKPTMLGQIYALEHIEKLEHILWIEKH